MDWMYAYFSRDGELLYIGLAVDPAHRATGHRSSSKWWRWVAYAEVYAFPAKVSGREEQIAIHMLEPLFNAQYRTYGYEEVIEFCARQEAWDLVDDYTDLASYGNDDPARLACEALGRRFPYRLHMANWEIDA
jgi:hypothetical protein